MTIEEEKAFEFAEKEEFGCQSVEQVLSDWQGYKVFAPQMKYCTDNATMIACAAYPQYIKGDFADLSLRAKSQEYFFSNSSI